MQLPIQHLHRNYLQPRPSLIEFPPGATILLPSAHSNLTISTDETRYSFTQYTTGALFRWVEQGLQKSEEFYASLSDEELEAQQEKDKHRWEYGLPLFPEFP